MFLAPVEPDQSLWNFQMLRWVQEWEGGPQNPVSIHFAKLHLLDQVWGTCLLSRAAWIVESLWLFYLDLPRKTRRENYAKEREILLLTYCLHMLSWRFVLTRCCVLTWVTKILMRAIIKCSRRPNLAPGPQVPQPCLRLTWYRHQMQQIAAYSELNSNSTQLSAYCYAS